jgi:hypothetical protein
LTAEAALVVNCAFPLDDRLMLVKVVPYSVYENGSGMVVTRSFEWFPMSVVPGTILPPICFITYWPTQDGGVAVAVGVGEAVAVDDGVTVGVDDVGVGVGDAVGLGVGVGARLA